MPALRLASSILQGKGKDGIALLDGVLLVLFAGESLSDGVESGGGRELVCGATPLAIYKSGDKGSSHVRLPFLRDIVAVELIQN